MTLIKSTTASDYSFVDEVINYSYLVGNNGNVTLTQLNITDDRIASGIVCSQTTLAPAENTTCTGAYSITQADLDDGSVTNTASASAQTAVDGEVVSPVALVTVPAQQDPGLTLLKSSSIATFSTPGQVISYSYLVSNTGNVTLNQLDVSDNRIATVVCPVTTLQPQATTTCSASYTVIQADLDAGSITNSATASAQSPSSANVISNPSILSVNADQNPALKLAKSSTTANFSAPGQSISYTYVVHNTGNVTLNQLSVSDDKIATPNISCLVLSLAPGASTTCSASYSATQADVDQGLVTNIASVSARSPAGAPVTSTPSSATVLAIQNPALNLLKSSTTPNFSAAAQAISYHYQVSNTGNVTLNSVVVNDDKIPSANIACATTTLAPLASTSCTGTYTTTLADIDFGSVTNTAMAVAQTALATPVSSTPSSITVEAVLSPAIALIKSSATANFTSAGQTIAYAYRVSNTGNDTLNNVLVSDDKIATANITCPVARLAPNDVTVCTASYTTRQADVDTGSVTNVATVSAQNAQGTTVVSESSTVTVDAATTAAIALTETALPASISLAGETLTYSYTVVNTGAVVVNGLSISDTQTAPSTNASLSTIVCPLTTLVPGASTTCTATYTVTAADIANGAIANSAVASATDPTLTPVESNTANLVTRAASVTTPAIPIPALAPWLLVLMSSVLALIGSIGLRSSARKTRSNSDFRSRRV